MWVIATILLLSPLPEPAVLLMETGYLSAYDQNPTDATLDYRRSVGDIPFWSHPDTVYLAVSDCGLMGKKGVLEVNGNSHGVVVFDCAGADSVDWMRDNSILAEVDYYTRIANNGIVGSFARLKLYE